MDKHLMLDYAISKIFVTLGNASLVPSVTLVEVVDLSRLRELPLLVISTFSNKLELFIQQTEATKQ